MSDSDGSTWIHWFCSQRGHEFFCEVDEDYIQDKFNLNLLDTDVDNYRAALEIILDLDNGSATGLETKNIDENAEKLYGLIHARYIMTNPGIDIMLEKYIKGVFGICPRAYCQRQQVLPIGLSDIPGEGTVHMYCPKCCDIYLPKSSRHGQLDGAYFGSGFPHMLFMAFPDLRPKRSKQKYVPRLFGFKLNLGALKAKGETGPKDDQEEED